MYSRIWALAVLMGVASPLPASSPCGAYPAGTWKLDQASAVKFEQAWLKALEQKDVAAIDCMLDDNFKDSSLKGELRPKAQVLRELPQKRPGDGYQQKLTDLQADLFGDTAVVRGINVVSDQQGHEVLRIRFTDVLRFSEGRWRAVSAQETAEQQQP